MTDEINIKPDSLRTLANLLTGDPMDKVNPDLYFSTYSPTEPWPSSGPLDQYVSLHNDVKVLRDNYIAGLADYHDAAKALLSEIQATSQGITKMADRMTGAEGKNVGDVAKIFEGY